MSIRDGPKVQIMSSYSWRGQEMCLFSTVPKLVLGPHQPPKQWVPRALSPEMRRRNVKLTSVVHLVFRLRIRGTFISISIDLHGEVFH
jgi:hypothetical protein